MKNVVVSRVFGNTVIVPDSSVKQAEVSAVGANISAEGTNL